MGRVTKETVEEGRVVIMDQEVLLWLVAMELVVELLVLMLCCCLLPRSSCLIILIIPQIKIVIIW